MISFCQVHTGSKRWCCGTCGKEHRLRSAASCKQGEMLDWDSILKFEISALFCSNCLGFILIPFHFNSFISIFNWIKFLPLQTLSNQQWSYTFKQSEHVRIDNAKLLAFFPFCKLHKKYL